MSILENKRIILGVTGSIAVYKAADLASKLTQAGVMVDVVMTASAQKFITPLTFQAVTGRPVYTDMWQADVSGGLGTHIAHVGLGEDADAMLVAPATANTMAKLAQGFADDLLSITALTLRAPLIVAPAMDGGMYTHPATAGNLQTLKDRGAIIIEPEAGRFASGLVGKGRLPDTHTLIGHLRTVLGRNGVLAGRKVVITAGGTREAIDPVRFITNHSSGKQGYALARAAIDAGAAEVILISTINTLPLPIGVQVVEVSNAREMLAAVQKHSQKTDVLIMAAAVSDFRPATPAAHKIKKNIQADEGMSIELERNPDILLAMKEQRQATGLPSVVVGFAAESQDLVKYATDKLQRKGLDIIVANDIMAQDAGFQSDSNRVILLKKDGTQTDLALQSKATISDKIIAEIGALIALSN